MGSFANSVFSLALGWIRGVAAAVWSLVNSPDAMSSGNWIGDHWKGIAVCLCAIGLVVDLAVYLFRWQPYKVWASFFRRRGSRDEEEQAAGPRPVLASPKPELAQPSYYQAVPSYVPADPAPVRRRRSAPAPAQAAQESAPLQRAFAPAADQAPRSVMTAPEEDFRRWQAPENPQPQPAPVQRTPAGYAVPADSPYRRPAAQASARKAAPAVALQTDQGRFRERDRVEKALQPQRRRFRHILTDDQDLLERTVEPQHLIDAREAYRDPVYPRKWKDTKPSEDE